MHCTVISLSLCVSFDHFHCFVRLREKGRSGGKGEVQRSPLFFAVPPVPVSPAPIAQNNTFSVAKGGLQRTSTVKENRRARERKRAKGRTKASEEHALVFLLCPGFGPGQSLRHGQGEETLVQVRNARAARAGNNQRHTEGKGVGEREPHLTIAAADWRHAFTTRLRELLNSLYTFTTKLEL